jgi:N utilization substance protein A
MENVNLIESFSEFKEAKSIDRETMMRILEDVFRGVLIRKYGTDENVSITVNVDRGDLEIWRTREVVEDEDYASKTPEEAAVLIPYSEAIKIEPDFEVGEEVSEEIFLQDFGRREILNIRQGLVSKIQEYENNIIYKRYTDRVGQIITGEVYQIWKKEILLTENGVELVLPKQEQIPTDFFHKGDVVRAVIIKVDVRNNAPIIVLSRTSPVFLERLLEQEVPEIFDGLITIKHVEREPGERAKVVVESYDERIDPVGACVGVKGSRIHGIVRELRQENIDVIPHTTNAELLITRALNPAKVTSVKLNEDEKRAEVFMKVDQLSMAIGKGGCNIKLAGRISGYEIDVFRDDAESQSDEDVDLVEFGDEIEEWIIKEFQKIGLDTAKDVLNTERDDLIKRTDLEEETIDEVLKVLRSEFE